MAYYDLAQLAQDADFRQRVGAAAQSEGLVEVAAGAVEQWVANNVWLLAASPGFSDAYASAIESHIPNPGRDPSVISDSMILSAIQAHMPPDEPGP